MELNREQIIKALECCTSGINHKGDIPCLDCPYDECNIVGGTSERQITGTCQSWLKKDALSLIKELTEENKSLTETVKVWGETIEELQFDVTDISEDNRKLIEERDVYKTWAYNKNALLNSMTDKIEAGYEPSAARASAEAEMWQIIALREKQLTEEKERLRELGTTKEIEKEIVRRETRADTVRKMQEQIKAEIDYFDRRGGSAFINKAIVFFFIDQIANELMEGKNAIN